MSKNESSVSRRAFLRRTAALVALPTVVPSSVFGRNGAVPPSERIILGGIGLRGRGMHVSRRRLCSQMEPGGNRPVEVS